MNEKPAQTRKTKQEAVETDKKKDHAGESRSIRVQQPKRTPNHPTKSHVVVAKVGDKVKTIRFGQQG